MSNAKPHGNTPPSSERLQTYWGCLRTHKERKSVREIMERELLLAFININKDRINEYPLLPVQQQAIIDFMTVRSVGTPLHEHTSKVITSFINALNKYGTLLTREEAEAAAKEEPHLLNQESLLLKSVQGVVYTTALTVDNFTEILIRYYGEEAFTTIDDIMEHTELGPEFWKRHFDHFIVSQIDEAYTTMVEKGGVSILKEQGHLVLRYAFDDVLERLKQTDKNVEKTRAQIMYGECVESIATESAPKELMQWLNALSSKGYAFTPTDITTICCICCMDPAGKDFGTAVGTLRAAATGADTADAPASPYPASASMTLESATFIQQQVLAMACSVATGLHIIRQDLLKSLTSLSSREVEQIQGLLGRLDLASLEKAFFAMLELQFISILRKVAGDDLGKMQIKMHRERRNEAASIDALAEKGLNRVRKNKVWKADPDSDEHLLFIPGTPRELKALIDIMQFEPALLREVILHWEQATPKLVVGVHLNLGLIARTTTNLSQRLAEILNRFGVKAS